MTSADVLCIFLVLFSSIAVMTFMYLYSCFCPQVADIKRVNNLMQEQDLFALKSIKIPVQKHSLLTETCTDLRDPAEELPRSSAAPATSQDRARAQPHLQEVTDFLMEVDHDIEKLIQTTIDQDDDFLDNSSLQRSRWLRYITKNLINMLLRGVFFGFKCRVQKFGPHYSEHPRARP